MFTFPILITVNLTVKQNVKHIVPIDNVIRIHILMYILIVISYDAHIGNGTHHFMWFSSPNMFVIVTFF